MVHLNPPQYRYPPPQSCFLNQQLPETDDSFMLTPVAGAQIPPSDANKNHTEDDFLAKKVETATATLFGKHHHQKQQPLLQTATKLTAMTESHHDEILLYSYNHRLSVFPLHPPPPPHDDVSQQRPLRLFWKPYWSKISQQSKLLQRSILRKSNHMLQANFKKARTSSRPVNLPRHGHNNKNKTLSIPSQQKWLHCQKVCQRVTLQTKVLVRRGSRRVKQTVQKVKRKWAFRNKNHHGSFPNTVFKVLKKK